MYLVFGWTVAFGGFNDYRGKYDTIEEAKEYIERSELPYGQIVLLGKKLFKVMSSYDNQRHPQWSDRA